MTSGSNIEAIEPAELCAYLRTKGVHRDSEEWRIALYWRGIITQGELFSVVGSLTDQEIDNRINALRAEAAEWLLSEGTAAQ